MSISSTVLPLLCLGRVLGINCPSMNQDPNNAGKCGYEYGRCNPYLEDYAPTHEYYSLYCSPWSGWCGSTADYQNAGELYDFKPTSCTLPSADDCKSAVDQCFVGCSTVLCECLGHRVAVDDPSEPNFCVDDDCPMFEQCSPLADAHLSNIGDPACIAADDECMYGCIKEQCACDVNRIEVTEEECQWAFSGEWGVSSTAHSAAAFGARKEEPRAMTEGDDEYGARKDATPVDVAPTSSVPTSMYVLGGLIAALLACIASVLCFAICVRPLVSSMRVAQTKTDYDVVNEDENVRL